MTLYKHQQEAVDKYKDSTDIALFFEMGCLSGFTEVDVKLLRPATNTVKRVTINTLTKLDIKDVEIKCMANGYFDYRPIKAILNKGIKPVVRITAENGKSIVCTDDHEFYTEEGWKEAKDLEPGCRVYMNGRNTCYKCGSDKRVIQKVTSPQFGLCLSCARKMTNIKIKDTKYKLSKEGYVKVQGEAMRDYPGKRCSDKSVLEQYLVWWQNTGEVINTETHTIHHKNGIKTDNRFENLQCMTHQEHTKLHADTVEYNTDGSRVSHSMAPDMVSIVDIKQDGQTEVFDIVIDSEEIHNFIANGFVVHNCGKTATALKIAEHKFNKKEIDAMLVIAPNEVHRQWANEQIPLWLDAKSSILCFGGRGGKKEFYDPCEEDNIGIVCVNIDTFSQPNKWEQVVEWANSHNTMIVLDEATSIKNVSAKRTQRILYEFNDVVRRGKTIALSKKKDNTKVRCVLTGTPVTNGPMDLWAIMEFVKPNFFGRNWYSFKNYYGMFTRIDINGRIIAVPLTEKTWESIKHMSYEVASEVFGISGDTYMTIQHQDKFLGPYKHADELRDKLSDVAVFRKLVDCVDMPEKNYIVRTVSMSAEQQAVYNDMTKQYISYYADHISTALNKLTVSIRLQQISSGFIMGKAVELNEDMPEDVTPDEVVWLSDVPRLKMLMNDIAELDKPLLILTKYSAEAAKIYEMLEKEYRTCLITGWKRVGSIERFKSGEFDIMVANIAIMAMGHNLQICHNTIYYSNTFSMELRQQSEFRTFRAGQKHPCTYIDYMSSPVDKTIMDALKQKKNLLDYVRDMPMEELVK